MPLTTSYTSQKLEAGHERFKTLPRSLHDGEIEFVHARILPALLQANEMWIHRYTPEPCITMLHRVIPSDILGPGCCLRPIFGR